MRTLILMLLLSLTACSILGPMRTVDNAIGNIEEVKVESNPDLSTPDGQKEKFTTDLGSTMRWGAIACIIATIVLFVLSFKIQAMAHLCVFTGSGAVLCIITLYSLSYVWLITGILFWGLVVYAGVKIYYLIKERNEERELGKELAIHFDDNDGEEKLSDKAKEKYLLNRAYGDVHKWDDETE